MSEHTNGTDIVLDDAQRRAQAAVRAIGAPPVDDDFRQRLKASFVSGAIEELDAGTREAEDWVTPGRDTTFWPLLQLAAAAAIVVMAAHWFNAGPDLHIASTPAGSFVVDGTQYSTNDLDAIPLRAGSSVTFNSSGPAELLIDDVALIEVAPGTRFTVPRSPGKWFSRDTAMHVEHGEVRFLSGVDFPGTTMRFTTPEGMVEVVGTLLSVQRDETGTCVCVLEGAAMVGVDEADLERVDAGSRKVMPEGGGDPFIATLKPMHVDGVKAFHEGHGHLIAR